MRTAVVVRSRRIFAGFTEESKDFSGAKSFGSKTFFNLPATTWDYVAFRRILRSSPALEKGDPLAGLARDLTEKTRRTEIN
jgi:hypothetical protein